MKRKIFSILFAVVLVCSFSLVTAVPVAANGPDEVWVDLNFARDIDGVLSPGEWGEPLCTTVGYTHGILTVTVYAHATMDALYLAFDTSDMTDNRGGAGLDVLDWNVGLVGSDFAPPGLPWRYVLVTKVYPDNSWGDSWSEIDNGYYGSWGETWNPNYYSPIPEGIEMVTSFGTGRRVTEFKVPMSLMFDGEHGWNGPSGGETLLLGGCFTGEDSEGTHDQLWWPTGIDHSQEGTYATIEVDGRPSTPLDGRTFGFDAFVTIQGGINGVAGSIVNVAAGTYHEGTVVIEKSLTIQGAGKADTILDAGGAQYGISIRTKPLEGVLDYVAIKDLTVKNAYHSNIIIYHTTVTNAVIENVDLSGSEPADSRHSAGLGVNGGTVTDWRVEGCTFENIKRFGVRVDSGSVVGELTVIASDFDTDEEALIIDGIPSQAGIESCGNIGDLTVSGSTFTGTVNGIRLFWYWTDRNEYSINSVDIEGSTFDGNDVGFFFYIRDDNNPVNNVEASKYEIGDIQIHYCSFIDNGWGVKFSAPEGYEDVVIDATNNWWGDASGPSHSPGYGSGVSDNVLYNPWLLWPIELGVPPTTFGKTLQLNIGWTLVSTDNWIDATESVWVGLLDNLAYKHSPAGFEEATLTDLVPVDALYVKTEDGGAIGIIYSGGVPAASSKDLEAGWNLISSATIDNARAILSPLRFIDVGEEQGVGLATVVSQGPFNQHTPSFYLATLSPDDWGILAGNTLNPFDGYWVYMNDGKNFGVVPGAQPNH